MHGILRSTKNKAALCGLLFAFSTVMTHATCSADRVSLRGDWGQIEFRVEVADTPETPGMLFIYEKPSVTTFWMRNTLIPLDMLFIDPDGRIAHIHENAIPLDETSIPGGVDRLAVLEINGGLTSELGLTVGSVIRHPQMPQDIAIWPCNDG